MNHQSTHYSTPTAESPLDPSEIESQVCNNAAPDASTLHPLKPPYKSHGGFHFPKHLTGLPKATRSASKHCTRTFFRFWDYGWTAEVCSYIFSLLTFGGLVTILLVHQNKPIPEWPQLVSINSIVSLFSLFTGTEVGLVLAEDSFLYFVSAFVFVIANWS